MSRAGVKCVVVVSVFLFCVAAIGSAPAQSIQLRKQTKTAPLPKSVKPKPAVEYVDTASADADAAAADAVAAAVDAAVDAAVAAADAAAAAAPRDRWLKVYEDDESTISFDTETVSRDGLNVMVWKRTIFKANQKSRSGKTFISTVTRNTYYCHSRQSSHDQITWRNSAGEVVYSDHLKSWEIERHSIQPDTVGEALWEAACE